MSLILHFCFPSSGLSIKWVRVAVAASVPADTISRFVAERVRVDQASASDICSAWLMVLRQSLQPLRTSANVASASYVVNDVEVADTARTMLLDDGSSSVSGGHPSPLFLGVNHSLGAMRASSGSALCDIEYAIALLRPVFTAIHGMGVKISPTALSRSVEDVSDLLDLMHSEALQIRIKPNEALHSRLVAALLSVQSILTRIQPTYVDSVFMINWC
jgi:hypothetical protein